MRFAVVPLQADLDTGRVDRAAFDRHVSELLGQSSPGREAKALTKLAVQEWRATGDLSWLIAIRSIDDRLALCLDCEARSSGPTAVRESVARYRAWRADWLARRAGCSPRAQYPGERIESLPLDGLSDLALDRRGLSLYQQLLRGVPAHRVDPMIARLREIDARLGRAALRRGVERLARARARE